MQRSGTGEVAEDVAAAVSGDRAALERVVRNVQPQIFQLAVRFFGDRLDAEDATQEALIQVVTRLDRFSGGSAFATWVYRVATNKFLSMTRGRGERAALSLAEFDAELGRLPQDRLAVPAPDVEEALLLEELRIGCTLAMLLCLDRDHRLAYILGEIMELDHHTAAQILDVGPAAFRKRLQRARERITNLMRSRCGLFDPANACRCRTRLPAAIERGCVKPGGLKLTGAADQARQFPNVLLQIRKLEEAHRAGALYRTQPQAHSLTDLTDLVRSLFSTD